MALVTRVDEVRAIVAGLVAEVPQRTGPGEVDALLDVVRRLEASVAALRTQVITCAHASRAHEAGGHAAPPSYLKEALGVSGRDAAAQDRLARDLSFLPDTRGALAEGDIGPDQASTIGRAARQGTLGAPGDTEGLLLPLARELDADGFRTQVRQLEQEADRRSAERAERRAHSRRRASLAKRKDGMWDLNALLTAEHGEALATALDAFRTFDPPDTPIPEQRSPMQRTADAFTDVVAAALRAGMGTSAGVLPHLNIVVPLEAIDATGEFLASLPHGGTLPPGAVERLLCDANLRRLVTRGDSEVLDAGRSRRQWNVAQRQALWVRDGGCRGPGCDRPPAWTHAHHIQPWTEDGPTSLENGLLLCSRHHHMVHEDGWTVRLDTRSGRAVFRSPTGREVVTLPHRPGGRRDHPPPAEPPPDPPPDHPPPEPPPPDHPPPDHPPPDPSPAGEPPGPAPASGRAPP